jgi:hypothetical protein
MSEDLCRCGRQHPPQPKSKDVEDFNAELARLIIEFSDRLGGVQHAVMYLYLLSVAACAQFDVKINSTTIVHQKDTLESVTFPTFSRN